MKKIQFNPFSIMYEFTINGDRTKKSFDTRNEADFYFISTYKTKRVKNYSDCKVTYCNDGNTIAAVHVFDKKTKAAS